MKAPVYVGVCSAEDCGMISDEETISGPCLYECDGRLRKRRAWRCDGECGADVHLTPWYYLSAKGYANHTRDDHDI